MKSAEKGDENAIACISSFWMLTKNDQINAGCTFIHVCHDNDKNIFLCTCIFFCHFSKYKKRDKKSPKLKLKYNFLVHAYKTVCVHHKYN